LPALRCSDWLGSSFTRNDFFHNTNHETIL
jgi:hypothetical protein